MQENLFVNYKNNNPADITSLAIGCFDGMHIAHKKLFEHLDKNGAILVIERDLVKLTPGRTREYFCSLPIFYLDLKKILNLSSEEFLQVLLENFKNLEKIVVGYDFRFGKNRAGDAFKLKTIFAKEVVIIDEVCMDFYPVHSKDIITFIKQGKIVQANCFLGRNFMIEGDVIKGQGLGAKKLSPTINIKTKDYVVPKNGVYVGEIKIDKSSYKCIIFVGHRLSTDGKFCIETHILENFVRLSEKKIQLFFINYLRENRKFKDLESLKKQIASDIEKAQLVLNIG